MKNKIVEFFKSKGYIFIALICLAAVIAAGVSIINLNNEDVDEPVVAYRTPDGGRTDVSTPTKNPNASTPQSTIASKPIDDNENNNNNNENNEQTGKISIMKPVEGEIQTEFAAKKLVFNTTLQEWRTHSGIDIAAKAGSDIKAAGNGKISAVKSDPRYGLTVVIDHDINEKTFTTIYCGLQKTADGMIPGKEVKAGDIIGSVGEDIFCEKAQGAHLHFELFENNIPLDPTEYWK